MKNLDPHPDIWIGYARHKPTGWLMLIHTHVWTKPLQITNQYGEYPPTSNSLTRVTYNPGSNWATTSGTPRPRPHELKDWEFLLVRYSPTIR